MAQMLYDLVPPNELIEFVRAYDMEILRDEAKIVLDQYLPNKTIEDLEYKIRTGGLQDVDAAEFRNWDTPAPMMGRQGLKRISGSIAPLARQIPVGEEEFHRIRILRSGSNNPLIDQIYDDSKLVLRAVQVRIELARGDLIDDGIVTIAENGLAVSADWGRDASMFVTAGTAWTSTSSTPLADMLGWLETYIDLNGVEPDHILTPRIRIGNLALNTEMRQYAAANGTIPTRVNEATINEIMAAEGLPPFRVYDGMFRVAGVRTRVFPQDKIYFMPPPGEALGNTFYGPTAEALRLQEKGFITASAVPGVVACVMTSDDPVQTFTKAAAVALPAMPNPNLIMRADVA